MAYNKKPYNKNKDKTLPKFSKEPGQNVDVSSTRDSSRKSSSSLLTLNSLIPVSYPFSSTSLKLQDPGSSSQSEVTKLDVYFDPGARLISSNWATIDSHITAIIKAYGSAHGYTPVVTSTQVRDYLIASARAFATLLTLKRYYDGQSALDRFSRDLSFLTTSRVHYSGTGITDMVRQIGSNAAITIHTENGTLSNAQWASTILNHLNKVRLPKSFVPLLVALFSGVFKIPGEAGSFLVFHETQSNQANSYATQYAALIAALDVIIAAAPDLNPIMDLLEFGSVDLFNLDFSRDITGKTISVIEDPLFHYMQENGGWMDYAAITAESDADIANIYHILGANSSIFNGTDFIGGEFKTLALSAIITRRVTGSLVPMFAARVRYQDNTVVSQYVMMPCQLSISGTETDANKLAALENLSAASNRFAAFFKHVKPIVTKEIDVVLNTPLTYATPSVNISRDVVLDDDLMVVRDEDLLTSGTILSLIFGAEYRSVLAAKLAQIQAMRYNMGV